MGNIWSTVTTRTTSISGNNNSVWLFDGVKINVSSIIESSLRSLSQEIYNITAANNFDVAMNITLIIIIFVALLTFIYVSLSRRFCRNEHSIIVVKQASVGLRPSKSISSMDSANDETCWTVQSA